MGRWAAKNSSLISLAIGASVAFSVGIWVNLFTGALSEEGHGSLLKEMAGLRYWHGCLIIAVALLALQVRLSRISDRRLRVSADDLIGRILEVACKSLVFPRGTRHIRAIVTVRDGDSGQRNTRYWYNTAPDPERTASFPLAFGVAGEAYTTRSVVVRELSPDHVATYQAEIQPSVHPLLKTVMAAPLLASEDRSDEPLGVLAFDSTLSPHSLSFDRPEARDLAQGWADIVARLLTARGD